MKALVIDDSKAMRLFLKSIVQDLGFESVDAADGKLALDAADAHAPLDLALVDWNMPVMNGLEFVQNIRKNPRFQAMKIVMVTTENSMEAMTAALDAGADDFLMKPIMKEMVSDKLTILGLLS